MSNLSFEKKQEYLLKLYDFKKEHFLDDISQMIDDNASKFISAEDLLDPKTEEEMNLYSDYIEIIKTWLFFGEIEEDEMDENNNLFIRLYFLSLNYIRSKERRDYNQLIQFFVTLNNDAALKGKLAGDEIIATNNQESFSNAIRKFNPSDKELFLINPLLQQINRGLIENGCKDLQEPTSLEEWCQFTRPIIAYKEKYIKEHQDSHQNS